MPEVNNNNDAGKTVIINQVVKKSNGLGVAGFVLAIIAIFLGWVPIIGWILWALGLLFSFIGMFKKPRGLAIAGFVISLIGLAIILVATLGVCALAFM